MEFRSCARGVSGVASLITTDEQLQKHRGCCFLVQAMLPEGFPFYQFKQDTINANGSDSFNRGVFYKISHLTVHLFN